MQDVIVRGFLNMGGTQEPYIPLKEVRSKALGDITCGPAEMFLEARCGQRAILRNHYGSWHHVIARLLESRITRDTKNSPSENWGI